MFISTVLLALAVCYVLPLNSRTQAQKRNVNTSVIKLWGDRMPPGPSHTNAAERDMTKATDRIIAGRRIVRLGNVSSPELHIFPRNDGTVGDTAVVICPGGGFSILAWDLEGTEAAGWLNSIGITVGVLKYRVPTKDLERAWKAPVQDTQRAISLMRSLSDDLKIDKTKIGALGFSAGAIAAGRAGLLRQRQYEPEDDIDQNPCDPDFMILIYGGGLIDDSKSKPLPELTIDEATPPIFMVHAFDDHVPLDTPVVLLKALKAVDVRAELHVYDAGGHGYGLRAAEGFPVTSWPDRCRDWLDRNGWVQTAPERTLETP